MPARRVFTLQSSSEELTPLRGELRKFLEAAGFSGQTLETVLVAVGEACANSIRHSYHGKPGHEIKITAEDAEDRVTFALRDYGEKIDLASLTPPALPPRKPGGLGVYFIQTIMDEVRYNTGRSRGNELILVKYKKGRRPSA